MKNWLCNRTRHVQSSKTQQTALSYLSKNCNRTRHVTASMHFNFCCEKRHFQTCGMPFTNTDYTKYLRFNAYFTIVQLYYSMQLVFLFFRTKSERKIFRPNVRQNLSKLQHLAWILLAFSFLRRAPLTFNNNKHECFISRRPSHAQFSIFTSTVQ